ncbi:AMP-binding protein [Streptomyces sp. NPDC058001]|uniref:AMP-binding protein n=1 Tax=Streptomyces sp. NPDC058001 TaxID=3346300 RepID=UPI0036EB2A5E
MEQVLASQRRSGHIPPVPHTDTVLHALARALATVPDQVFLDFSGELHTYADVDRRATRFAHELLRLGVTPGQTVASVLDNNIDQIVSWLAINKAGAVWVPLNTAYRGEFLRHQLDDSLASIAVVDQKYLTHVADISEQLPHLRLVLRRGSSQNDNPPPCFVPVKSLDDHRGTDETPIPVTARPGDPSLLIYTSGTTGPSKGCMISHNYICNQARQSNECIPPRPDEVMYTPLPLFHTAALDVALSALLSHTRVAIAERFSVTDFWAELRRVWKERFGVEFASSFAYGQSEGVRLSMHRLGDPLPPEDSCGRIADDSYEVAVLDEDDNLLPDGQLGEIAFRPRGPHVMFAGYWRRPADTVHAWRNLWMHTGDYGRIENGYLFFVDRKKDYLRSRGENISSFEVERAFLAHPALREVAAHPADGGVAEDSLKITAVLNEGHHLTEEELCRWALDRIPHFAVPRYIEFRDELPRTPTNKIQKYRLRQDGVTEDTWDRETAGIRPRRR